MFSSIKLPLAALAFTILATGAVQAQPMTPPAGPHGDHGPMGEKMFERADSNHDGFITLDEMIAMQREHTEKMFKEADTNHDGKLSHEEVKAWREAMRAKMMQRWAARKAERQQQAGASVIDANRPVTPAK